MPVSLRTRTTVALSAVAALALSAGAVAMAVQQPSNGESPVPGLGLVPSPVSLQVAENDAAFVLTDQTRITFRTSDDSGASTVANYLAELIRPATGLPLPVEPADNTASEAGDIELVLDDDAQAGEAYSLVSGADGVRVTAATPAGLFNGVQTLRQLLPAQIESDTVADARWSVPAVTIADQPRFAYRGAMLDVARHFFAVEDVKRYIDDIAMLKINHLHLHLTDDQGWRIEITSWPNLTDHGALLEVGGGTGGYYTQDDYREIVAYAESRFITIVPEIDVPGHTNAALASYPELTCDGIAPELYTGIAVGFSSLCIRSERTYEFLDDVFREVAELTPGPYLHIGGDESRATPDDDFLYFVERAASIAASHGKTVVGWHELGKSPDLPAGSIGQYWGFTRPEGDSAANAGSFIEQGGQLIMSPANVAYLDMKYDNSTALGLAWAQGPTSVSEAASWDPAEILAGVGDEQLLGIEAPLWSETLESIDDIETMAFPRIAVIAELAWSPKAQTGNDAHSDELKSRLGAFGQHLDVAGIHYFRTGDVHWQADLAP